MYKNILIATDGSELARKAVTHGLALAKAVNAPVTIVAATEIWSAREMAAQVRTDTQAIENTKRLKLIGPPPSCRMLHKLRVRWALPAPPYMPMTSTPPTA